MANGDLLIQLLVPEKPSGSQLTDAEYTDAVKNAVSDHLKEIGLNTAMPSWKNRTDLPAAESGMPAYVDQRLAAAGFNSADYDFILASAGQNPQITVYCILDNQIQCYGTVVVSPKAPGDPDAFRLDVDLDNNTSVTVPIRFVVRPDAAFPI